MTAVASLLAGHVTFQLDSVDRLFIAGYVPQLQHEGGLVRFLLDRGYRIPSPAGLGHNHDRLVADLQAFVAEHDIPLVRFGKGESKEEVARRVGRSPRAREPHDQVWPLGEWRPGGAHRGPWRRRASESPRTPPGEGLQPPGCGRVHGGCHHITGWTAGTA